MEHDEGDYLAELLGQGLKPGEAKTAGPLTLIPLHGGRPAPTYLPAADAIGDGLLTIQEVGDGSVPQLAAHNEGNVPVLILDGEHLEGAMQDRVLNTTVLVAAQGKTILPVSCVEAGRWHFEDGGSSFEASPDFSYSRLRGANTENLSTNVRAGRGHMSDQSAVWAEVASKHAEINVPDSETGAMRDAYMKRKTEIDEMISGFEAPEPGATGVVSIVEGRPAAVDVFDKPEILERLWPRLVRGYAMDALGTTARPCEAEVVEGILSSAAGAAITVHDGIGLGRELIVSASNVIGKALSWEGTIPHLSLFPRDRHSDEPYARRPVIDSPRRRRARRHIDE